MNNKNPINMEKYGYEYNPFVKLKNMEEWDSENAHKLKQGKKAKQKKVKPVYIGYCPDTRKMRFDEKYQAFVEFIGNTRIKDNARYSHAWAYYFGYIMGTPLKDLPAPVKEHIAQDFPVIVEYLDYWIPRLRIGWFYFRNGVKDAQQITQVRSELFERYFENE